MTLLPAAKKKPGPPDDVHGSGISACRGWRGTGWGHDADRRRTREAGFDAHLAKSVDMDELMRYI